jgi:hypothetical protein
MVRSLMLVTVLSSVIGYDKASAIAHKPNEERLSLKEAALALRSIDERISVESSIRGRWWGRASPAAETGPREETSVPAARSLIWRSWLADALRAAGPPLLFGLRLWGPINGFSA